MYLEQRENPIKSKGARSVRPRAPALRQNNKKEVIATKFYTSKPTWYAYPEGDEQRAPRDSHATISVLKFKADELSAVDVYLGDCEQRFSVEHLKRMTLPAEQAWKEIMASTNARYFPRGKNTVLECLQFGGNREFWSGFASEQDIARYFRECCRYAVDKVGFLHTHENILCAAIITEQVRRNLFVWYLPITSKSLLKNTNAEQAQRFARANGDLYDEPPPYDDMPY